MKKTENGIRGRYSKIDLFILNTLIPGIMIVTLIVVVAIMAKRLGIW